MINTYRLRRGIFPTPIISAEHVRAEIYARSMADGYKVRANSDGHIVYIPCERWRKNLAAQYNIVGCTVMTIFGVVEVEEGDYIVHTLRGKYAINKQDFERYYEQEDTGHGEEKKQI